MHSLQTRIINKPMVPFSSPCGKFLMAHCIALNTMQACTDIRHTRAPVETATEGPGNCGDISSDSTILLAAFYGHMLSAAPRPTNQRDVVKQSSLADSKNPLLGLHSQQCTLAR
jgi:hypothetical protein